MSVREVALGRERFTSAHILVFTEEELTAIFGSLGARLRELALEARPRYRRLTVEVELCPGCTVPLGPGVTLISGVEPRLEGGLEVPPLLDEEFLEYLLLDIPRELDRLRRAVIVEGLDERFTRDVEAGVSYAVDILGRVAGVYRVPVIVTGGEGLSAYGFHRRIVRPGGRGPVYVDGEPVCTCRE